MTELAVGDIASHDESRHFSRLFDYELSAREKLVGPHWNGLFGDPGDVTWRTNQANLAAFDHWCLRPRVLTGRDTRNLATTVLGESIEFPVLVAPSGSHQRVTLDGELATARAAGRAGTVMTLSSISTFSIEEVAEAASGPLWFQLYVLKDRDISVRLIRRAEAAGYRALVVSVDNLAGRVSWADRKQLFRVDRTGVGRGYMEPGRVLRNFIDLPESIRPKESLDGLVDPELSWRDIEWLQRTAEIPVILKGIQTHEDAKLCAELGVKAIVVSNHGGVPPELEGLRASLDALPEVVQAVGRDVEVYHDGGIRSGRDVLKALALGARAVLTGRPIQWGLAVAGEDGAFGVLQTLRRELDSIMGVCGLSSVSDVNPDVIARVTGMPFRQL